jgi:proteasome assembly chaperone (PAC2) family protein
MATVNLTEIPQADELYMIAGWRQWADAGSVSSTLPRYLIDQTKARKIGTLDADQCYLFQIPGTHDLVRPVIALEEGLPKSLNNHENEIYFTPQNDGKGIVIFLGDEPHLGAETYAKGILEIARQLKVKRIVGLGGVYAELPYDKERPVSMLYSLPEMRDEFKKYAVSMSNYNGGASIGTVIAYAAQQAKMEYVSFYAFAPTYNFGQFSETATGIRIENDFVAWLGVMRRIAYMLGWEFDLSDLEAKADKLISVMDEKVDELEQEAPQLDIRGYLEGLSADFTETVFLPLDDVWEEELRNLFDDMG